MVREREEDERCYSFLSAQCEERCILSISPLLPASHSVGCSKEPVTASGEQCACAYSLYTVHSNSLAGFARSLPLVSSLPSTVPSTVTVHFTLSPSECPLPLLCSMAWISPLLIDTLLQRRCLNITIVSDRRSVIISTVHGTLTIIKCHCHVFACSLFLLSF